jgi:hypothetical protein
MYARFREAALISASLTCGITSHTHGQISRPLTLTSVVQLGLSPQGLSPYSITASEYNTVLNAATAADTEFSEVATKQASLDAARRVVRIAEARVRLGDEVNDAGTELTTAITDLEAAQAAFTAARNELISELIGQQISAQELAAFLTALNTQHTVTGANIIPWELLQPSQRDSLLTHLIAQKKPALNPGDALQIAGVRNLLAGFGSQPLVEFETRLARCQALAAAAGQWVIGN